MKAKNVERNSRGTALSRMYRMGPRVLKSNEQVASGYVCDDSFQKGKCPRASLGLLFEGANQVPGFQYRRYLSALAICAD